MYQTFAQTYPQGGGIEKVPALNTSKVTRMQETFYYCNALTKGPSFDTSNVTNINNMFSACFRLEEVPKYNTSKVTDFGWMFSNCYRLKTIPQMDISSGLNFNDMIRDCYALQGFGGFTFHGGTGTWNTSAFLRTFYNCYGLRNIDNLNLSGVCAASAYASVYSNMFYQCYSLQTLGITGLQHSFSIESAKLGPTALNNLYSSLAVVGISGAGAKTVTVTGNWGASAAIGHNPAIAISKGWTITI
jgi:hypothetical protein